MKDYDTAFSNIMNISAIFSWISIREVWDSILTEEEKCDCTFKDVEDIFKGLK